MQTLRILIAEDDKLSATLLKAMLEAEGHEVCAIASTGRETISAASECKPDAVLMDIYLADDVSGVDATRRIVHELGIPTLFITGASGSEIMDVVAESGALSFIKKPVSADELRANLRILSHHQAVTAALRKTARRARMLLDRAPMGVFLSSEAGELLECNATLAAMLGYASPVELLELRPTVAVLSKDEARHDMVMGMLRSGACINGIPGELIHKSGATISVREFGTAYTDEDGNGYQGIVVHAPCGKNGIAGQTPSGSFLRSTIDAVSDIMVLMDTDRTILEANKAFYKFFGKNKNGVEFCRTDFPCSGECPFSRFLEDGEEHAGWVRLTADGPEFYNTVSPVVDDEGEIVAAVQVFRAVPHGGKM